MKKMFLLTLMSVVTLSMNAQEKNDSCKARMEARIAMKAGKLANEFGLDDKKRAEFVALYTEYAQALAATRPQCKKQECKKPCQKADFSDADANEMIAKRMEKAQQRATAAQKRVDINKKYVERFRKVLTPKQTLKVIHFGKQCKAGKPGHSKCIKKMRRGQMQHGMRGQMHGHKPCGQMKPGSCPSGKPAMQCSPKE